MKLVKNYELVLNSIRKSLKDYITSNNIKTLVLGVSGGVDSALIAAISKPVCDELNINLLGCFIHIGTNSSGEKMRAVDIIKDYCSYGVECDLTSSFNSIYGDIDKIGSSFELEFNEYDKIRKGNVKARMRMTTLYHLAAKYNGIVLGTENLTEHYLGFFTRGGDEVSDIELINGLWKTEVYNLCDYIISHDNINDMAKKSLKACVECDATDGLGISNTDLDQILPDWKSVHDSTRSGYGEVDDIFINYFNGDLSYESNSVIKRYKNSWFKRNRFECDENYINNFK